MPSKRHACTPRETSSLTKTALEGQTSPLTSRSSPTTDIRCSSGQSTPRGARARASSGPPPTHAAPAAWPLLDSVPRGGPRQTLDLGTSLPGVLETYPIEMIRVATCDRRSSLLGDIPVG